MSEEHDSHPPAPTEPDTQMHDPPTAPAAMVATTKKRPRLDLTASPLERKRGKSMFGLVLGTLNKAKIEDKERNASEAAKKRQLIEQRLQTKLRKETDSVRRAEEAKKDKTLANRKEEELQLQDSIHKLRRTRFPLISNFLLTCDVIPPSDDSTITPPPPIKNTLAPAPRTHPPPLYYLPAILLPSQETFLARRKEEVKEAAELEWQKFKTEERATGIQEIKELRSKVAAEEEARKLSEKGADDDEMATDDKPPPDSNVETNADASKSVPPANESDKPTVDVEMQVDDGGGIQENKDAPKDDQVDTNDAVDDDDVVEY